MKRVNSNPNYAKPLPPTNESEAGRKANLYAFLDAKDRCNNYSKSKTTMAAIIFQGFRNASGEERKRGKRRIKSQKTKPLRPTEQMEGADHVKTFDDLAGMKASKLTSFASPICGQSDDFPKDRFWRSGIWTLNHKSCSRPKIQEELIPNSNIHDRSEICTDEIRDNLKVADFPEIFSGDAYNAIKDEECDDITGNHNLKCNKSRSNFSNDAVNCPIHGIPRHSYAKRHRLNERTSDCYKKNSMSSLETSLEETLPELTECTFIVKTLSISPSSRKRRKFSEASETSSFEIDDDTVVSEPLMLDDENSRRPEKLMDLSENNTEASFCNFSPSCSATRWKASNTFQQFFNRTFRKHEDAPRKMSSVTSNPSGSKFRKAKPPKETYYRPVKMSRKARER